MSSVPTLIKLPYQNDLPSYYQRLLHLPGFVLLESGDKRLGRYDILTAYPYQRLKIAEDGKDWYAAFEQLKEALTFTTDSAFDLPFQGGAIGYFSYDLGAMEQGLYSPSQPYLQGLPLLNFAFYDWALLVDHSLKIITLFAANTREETALIVEEILSLWKKKSPIFKAFQLKEAFQPLLSKADYEDAFNTIYRSLEEGRCYQVNYTQPFNASFTGDPWFLYRTISQYNPVPYAAFLSGEEESILSFSPERFLLHEQGVLLTSPIKGSERRHAVESIDKRLREGLLNSNKNKAENVMIVDLLRNDLGKLAKPGSVQVRSLWELQSFQGVHHLVSHIEALLHTKDRFLDAFKGCFPGGSITGAPKLEAMKVISECEPYARGIYCGNLAYFSRHGRFDSNIAIRTLIAKNEHLHLAAGGGIVIDSNWEEEYQECFIKIQAISQALGRQ